MGPVSKPIVTAIGHYADVHLIRRHVFTARVDHREQQAPDISPKDLSIGSMIARTDSLKWNEGRKKKHSDDH
jgi:hypothetical protein